jgi:hypothetical protein
MEMPLTVSDPVPLLVNVTVFAPLVVLTIWSAKLRLVGLSVTAGAVPVPVRFVLCGLPDASSVTETDAIRVPVAVGLKVTLTVQLLPAARVLGLMGQVLV